MTDGTSQGLFIVVAIVIFGIFVVLAYILFEDTLSPAMANMFTTATEQASDRLMGGDNVLQWDKLSIVNKGTDSSMQKTEDSIVFTSSGGDFEGILYPHEALKNDTSYILTFDMEVLSGIVNSLGGHMHTAEHVKIFVNGSKVADSRFSENDDVEGMLIENKWARGVKLDGSGKYHVEVHFDTNMWFVDFPYYKDLNTPGYQSLYIEGNRHSYGKPYSFKLTNMKLIEK